MQPARVLISGAAGQIGYLLAGRIAHGDLLGDRPVILHLFDFTEQLTRLSGLVMELEDCAFPTLVGTVITDKPDEAFADVDYAFFLASCPLKPGEVRRDLLVSNAPIYKRHGEWLREFAKPSIRVLVIANPVNTNTLVALHYATNLTAENFSCLSRLDDNRSRAELAKLLNVTNSCIHKVISWGNHAETQVPDTAHAEYDTAQGRRKVVDVLNAEFRHGPFADKITQRAWAVQKARGNTSALSAASASIDHFRNWLFGTDPDDFVSMGIMVPQDKPYGIKPGVNFSFPVRIDKAGNVEVVRGLEIDAWTQGMLDKTEEDLIEEKKVAFKALGITD
jgi:malate dehydrogenase